MIRNGFLARYLFAALLLAAVSVFGVYMTRITLVRVTLDRAREAFRDHRHEAAWSALRRASRWAEPHPVLVTALRRTAIVGHVRSGSERAALALAARLTDPPTNAHAPDDWAAWTFTTVAHYLDPFFLRGHAVDSRAGYQAYEDEVQAMQHSDADDAMARQPSEDAPSLEPAAAPGAAPQVPSAPTIPDSTPSLSAQPPTAPSPLLATRDTAGTLGQGQFAVVHGYNTRAYNLDGKSIGLLKPGAILRFERTGRSSAGEVVLLSPVGSNDTQAVVAAKRSDLTIREGDPAQLPPELRELLIREAKLEATLRERRVTHATRNPHYERMRAAREAYKAFISEAETLRRVRDTSGGEARMRAQERLTMLRNQHTDIDQEYHKAKDLYDTWKERYSVERDPAVISLQSELLTVRAELAGYFSES